MSYVNMMVVTVLCFCTLIGRALCGLGLTQNKHTLIVAVTTAPVLQGFSFCKPTELLCVICHYVAMISCGLKVCFTKKKNASLELTIIHFRVHFLLKTIL